MLQVFQPALQGQKCVSLLLNVPKDHWRVPNKQPHCCALISDAVLQYEFTEIAIEKEKQSGECVRERDRI